MHVIVAGAGIAGLGAAWRLREEGHRVTLVEQGAEVGGRCRSVPWHGLWPVTGAFAFLGAEGNLVDLSKKLGLYTTASVVDLTAAHRWNVLIDRREVVDFGAFDLMAAARHPRIPFAEKARLLTTLPKLVRQMMAADPEDIASVADFDDVSACDYFRRHSPTFVDYFLEPCMGMFCGYAEEDFSLAWTVWSSTGRLSWAGDSGMWTFRERGAGRLTWALGEHFAQDPGTALRLRHTLTQLEFDDAGVSAQALGPQGPVSIRADAAVVALPGHRVAPVMRGLDDARRAFFDQIDYAGHHILYYLLDRPRGELLDTYVLPAADGFRRTGNLRFTDLGDGRTFAHAQWKEPGCRQHADAAPQELLDLAWADMLDAVPALRGTRVIDRLASPQPAAICKRPVGYIAALRRWRELGPLPRVAFCGDYLSNSTVGQSHASGVRETEALMARCS